MPSVNLDLKSVTSPQSEGSTLFFIFAVAILPLTLLLEEFGFRLLPATALNHWRSITVAEKRAWRLWIFKHWFSIYIVVSALFAGLIHQINIHNASMLGSLVYFGVQTFSGCCFAWLYIHRGLGASWIIHVSWDLFIVMLNLILVSLQG